MSRPKNLATTLPARRQRSDLSRDEAVQAVTRFARRVERWAESSSSGCLAVGGDGGHTPPGKLTVQLLVHGDFGVAEGFFEGMRVLSGMKLPRKTTRSPKVVE